jgi:hypothetical protein
VLAAILIQIVSLSPDPPRYLRAMIRYSQAQAHSVGLVSSRENLGLLKAAIKCCRCRRTTVDPGPCRLADLLYAAQKYYLGYLVPRFSCTDEIRDDQDAGQLASTSLSRLASCLPTPENPLLPQKSISAFTVIGVDASSVVACIPLTELIPSG